MSNKKNILLIHAGADLYGAGKSLQAIVRVYTQKGWSVTVLLPYDGPLASRIRDLSTQVIIMELGVIRRKYLTSLGILNRFRAIRKAVREIKEICRHGKIDMIHTNTIAVLSGGIAAKSLNLPHLMHIREIMKGQRPYKLVLSSYLKRYVDFIMESGI